MSGRVELTIGDPYGPNGGVAGSCTVEFDKERDLWCATMRPCLDDEPLQAWADRQAAAAMAVFAKWLACETSLRDALPPSAEEIDDTRTLVGLLNADGEP